ncbi:hypothetical protein HWV62_31353 [Athelia sp. TMB]|nr:hypothetical protein HWV62_31353 [Athelia sp. TMB]
MSSYLKGWFSLETATPVPTAQSQPEDIPEILHVSPPPSDGEDEGEDTEREDDDVAPAFPALNSAQRASSSAKSGIPGFLTDTQRMPPPSLPGLAVRQPGTSGLTLPPSSRVSSSSPNSLSPGATTQKPPKKSKKVALAPGHGALDWASLKSSGADLRGVDSLMRIPPSVLKTHNKKDDAWSAFNGKVYNITAYLPFHPGGERELMRVAGRDGTKLFVDTHAWVNVDFMLDSCMVGFLVPEPSS